MRATMNRKRPTRSKQTWWRHRFHSAGGRFAFGGNWLIDSVIFASVLAVLTQTAPGQRLVLAAPGIARADQTDRPFLLPSYSGEASEALEDYQRYVKRGQWEKALEALDLFNKGAADKLAPGADGIMLPGRQLVLHLLADLPASGKNAYRVFHDAEAEKLLEQAVGDDEAAQLAKIATTYLITSVGDVAADRLGDLYFERGQIDEALAAWQSVLDHRPDSAIPRAHLLVKMAIGLARSGHWDRFEDIRKQVADRYPEEAVRLGGKDVRAAAHLAALARERSDETPTAQDSILPNDPRLPNEKPGEVVLPQWKFRWFGDTKNNKVLRLRNPYGQEHASDFVPPTAHDGQRLYANLLGYLLCIDLSTGKLIWRTAPFDDLPSKVQRSYTVFPEQYHVALVGHHLWSVTRNPEMLARNSNDPNFQLVCYDTGDGKELFNSKNVKELKSWEFLGQPVITDNCIYAPATKANQSTELYVLSIDRNDHKLLWSTTVGTYQINPNQMYGRRTFQPQLVTDGTSLYVDTQAGAVVALATATGSVKWGMYYESGKPDTEYWYNEPVVLYPVSQPQLVDGVLYIKGMRSTRLCAIDLSRPRTAWERPVSQRSKFIGMDEERFYFGGQEMLAIDRDTQKMLWARRLPQIATSYLKPVITRNRVYQYTSRGIWEIDKSTGTTLRKFRGADRESLGGVIYLTPGRLITVSNWAVTAYDISDSQGPSSATRPDAKTGSLTQRNTKPASSAPTIPNRSGL